MSTPAILLIWEEIPESTKVFLLADLDQEDFDKVCAAHGAYANSGDEDDSKKAWWLSSFLYDEKARKLRFDTLYDSDQKGKAPLEIEGEYTVVMSGVMM